MILLPQEDTFCTDWGGYVAYGNKCPFNFRWMVEQGLGLFIVESALEAPDRGWSTMTNIRAAREAEVPLIGTYPWLDPGEPTYVALDRYRRAMDQEQPHACWIDIEQEKDANGKVYDPQLISDRAEALWEGLCAHNPSILVDIYTRPDFILQWAKPMLKWIHKLTFPWIAAWPDWGLDSEYVPMAEIIKGNMRECLDISAPAPRPFQRINIFDGKHGPDTSLFPGARHVLWQSSSRMRPVEVRGDWAWDHQYDFGFASLPLEPLTHALKNEPIIVIVEPTMPNTYNKNTPHLDRARLVLLSDEDKQVDMTGICAGVDSVVLHMGGQDGPEHANNYMDAAFPIWSERATKPVQGMFTLDTNYPLWVKEYLYDPFTNRKWFQNETLKILLQSWLKNPFLDPQWKEGLVLKNDPALWHPIRSLIFFMLNTKYGPGSQTPGMWQLANLVDLIKPLKLFMDGGFIPKVPLYLMATSDFYKTYATDTSWLTLSNWAENGTLTGVGVYETNGSAVYQQMLKDTGKATELFSESPMASPFAEVAEIFAYRPQDSYQYTSYPYGFDPQFHFYSANRFRAQSAFYAGTQPTPLTVGEWCDTPQIMAQALAVSSSGSGGGNNGENTEYPALVERLNQQEARIAALEKILADPGAYLKITKA